MSFVAIHSITVDDVAGIMYPFSRETNIPSLSSIHSFIGFWMATENSVCLVLFFDLPPCGVCGITIVIYCGLGIKY